MNHGPLLYDADAGLRPGGGTPDLRVATLNTEDNNYGINIEFLAGSDTEYFDFSGANHFLGRGPAAALFPNGVNFDGAGTKTSFKLIARATTTWYPNNNPNDPHTDTITQTFELQLTDLPPPSLVQFTHLEAFRIKEGTGTRIIPTGYDTRSFGGSNAARLRTVRAPGR